MWHLHSHEGIIKPFANLTELAKSIETQANQKFRLAPSEYGTCYYLPILRSDDNKYIICLFIYLDKSASLLLCLPAYQLTAKTSINETSENEMRKRRAQLFHPLKDFRKYLSMFQQLIKVT